MQNHKAKLNFYIDTEDDYYLQLFEGMFPRDVLDTMVDGVNKQITGDPLTYGELLHWIALWVMMSTVAEVIIEGFGQHVILTFFMVIFSLCQFI